MSKDSIDFSAAIVAESFEGPEKVIECTLKLWDGIKRNHWKECHAVLYSDSTFEWFDKKENHSKPLKSILLKNVVEYICVGALAELNPFTAAPELPSQHHSILQRVAIGEDQFGSNIHWFLFDSDKQVENWFIAIAKTLPKLVIGLENDTFVEKHGKLLNAMIKYPNHRTLGPFTFESETLGEILLDYGFAKFYIELQKAWKNDVRVWFQVGASGKRWRQL